VTALATSPTDFLTLLNPVFGVATVIASILAGLSWGTVRNLRETITDLRGRVGDLDAHRNSLERDITHREARVQELLAENKLLQQIATGEVHWEALASLLTDHHKEAREHWKAELAALARLTEAEERLATSEQEVARLLRGEEFPPSPPPPRPGQSKRPPGQRQQRRSDQEGQ